MDPTTPNDSVAAAQAQIADLQAQVQALRQAAAATANQAATAAAAVDGRRNHIKVKAPEAFDGSRKDLLPFLTQLDLHLTLRAVDFTTEEEKLLFASTLLRGKAFSWIQPQLARYRLNQAAGIPTTSGPFVSMQAFSNELQLTFGDVDAYATAERELKRLRQTTSATAYSAEFTRITARLDFNDAAMASEYYYGLKDDVKDAITLQGRPKALRDLIKLSIELDNRQFDRQQDKRSQPLRLNTSRPRPMIQPLTRTTLPAGVPMEVDAISTRRPTNPPPVTDSPTRRAPLTSQEKQHRRDHNLCMYCGRSGHSVSGCAMLNQQARVSVSSITTTAAPLSGPTTPVDLNERA